VGSIAEKVFTSLWRLFSPPSASSYLDFLIARFDLKALIDFNVLGITLFVPSFLGLFDL